MTESTSSESETPRATVLKCVACGKLLATGAHVPRYDVAWCGCGVSHDIPNWFELPVGDSLAGFRLFRRMKSSRKSWWAALKARLPKIAMGLVGGLLIGTVLAVSIMLGTALYTPAMAPTAPHVVSR